VEPKCKFFSHCGGCQWLSTAYARQLREKELLLRSILRRHLPEGGPEAIVGAEPDRGYRHKGDFHVHLTGDTLRIGFYQEDSHHVVNLDFCLLFDRAYNIFYQNLRSVLREGPRAEALERLTLDRDEDGTHLREGASEEEAAALAKLGESAGLGGGLVTPVREPGRILARWGRPWTRYTLPGAEAGAPELRMQADVRSFTQAHYPMNRKLVGTVREWLGLARHERLLDLYSGIGNFSVPLASVCSEVVAVESGPTAHEDAKENARINGLLNLRHVLGEAAPWVAKMAAASESFDAVLLDPPRTGARDILETLIHLTPKRILYVSCNLPALERDLQILGESGYKPLRMQAWDLFPQTYSVETLCLLARS
jgi:23S rRNA (uracil1939-C5)-methyltransferase